LKTKPSTTPAIGTGLHITITRATISSLLPDIPNPYRQAALHYLGLMYSVDQFLTEAKDARFAVIVVAVVLGWPSAQGLTIGEIARQLGCTPAALTRSIARFKALAGLDSDGGEFIRPVGAPSVAGDLVGGGPPGAAKPGSDSLESDGCKPTLIG
jgi:hypothetical protein